MIFNLIETSEFNIIHWFLPVCWYSTYLLFSCCLCQTLDIDNLCLWTITFSQQQLQFEKQDLVCADVVATGSWNQKSCTSSHQWNQVYICKPVWSVSMVVSLVLSCMWEDILDIWMLLGWRALWFACLVWSKVQQLSFLVSPCFTHVRGHSYRLQPVCSEYYAINYINS